MKLKKSGNKKLSLSRIRKEIPQEKPKYANLQEVVDLNRPLYIMYSGVEDDTNFQILYDMGIRNFLISYFYVQRKHLQTTKYEELGVKFFVDSGAYSFNVGTEGQDMTIAEWEKYIQSYLRWVEKHRNIVFAIANLDIEYLVGGDVVQKWNEEYFEPFMLRTGIPVSFIYHDGATNMTWEQYCQRYPYVGISWGGADTQGNDLAFGFEKLRVAEKYNTVVHGMAMTKTALLTKLPFYTVDSTTWLVGLQYGEINYWTGQKMTRLKKDKWKGVMLDALIAKGFDRQKLLDEDTEEMIRVNVYAFIEAEKFVQERLKSSMYWLKPKAQKRTEEDIATLKFPSIQWMEYPDRSELEEYAKEFNISMANPDETENLVIDMTCFMHWYDEEYQEYIQRAYTPELLKTLHDTYVNRIVTSDEERVEDLIKFYRDNLLGENTTLLHLGTNFDRLVKERDEYVSDEEYETVDVSEMDVQNALSKYLPPPQDGDPAPEISSLDDEIFREEGITPVRDANGHFIKGQRSVLKPKKLYSDKYPKMSCDFCINAQKCPEYKSGYVCAYNKMFQRYNTRDMGDVIQAMQGIVDLSMQRLQRSMMTEVLNGGIPDPNVSAMMNQSMSLLANLQRMYESSSQEVIRQTKVVKADGTQEMTTQVSNPQSGGILERIFGNMTPSADTKDEDIIELPPDEDNT